jgi:predicted small secreted protein
MKHLPIIAFLLSASVTISGCNTIGGTIGGVGRDLTAIGDTFSTAGGSDCRHERCSKKKARRDCGPRGCRKLRSVASRCHRGTDCGEGQRYRRRAPRHYY